MVSCMRCGNGHDNECPMNIESSPEVREVIKGRHNGQTLTDRMMNKGRNKNKKKMKRVKRTHFQNGFLDDLSCCCRRSRSPRPKVLAEKREVKFFFTGWRGSGPRLGIPVIWEYIDGADRLLLASLIDSLEGL